MLLTSPNWIKEFESLSQILWLDVTECWLLVFSACLQSDDEKTTKEEETTTDGQSIASDKKRYDSGAGGTGGIEQCLPQMYIKVNSKYILPGDKV